MKLYKYLNQPYQAYTQRLSLKNLTINQFNNLFNKLEWHVEIKENDIILFQLINSRKVEKMKKINKDDTVPYAFFNVVQYPLK